MLKIMLEARGHIIVGVTFNGLAAIELYRELVEKPKIVLMDYRMPIKNGLEATMEILQLDPSAIIIFATADKEIKKEAIKMGAFCVLKKPFDVDDLLHSIARAVKM